MPSNTKKYSIMGIIIVLLILIGALTLSKNDTKENTHVVKIPSSLESDNNEVENNPPIETGGSIYSDADVPDIKEGTKEVDEITDITKVLIPVDEMYKTGMYGERKTEGLQSYCKIISLMPGERLEFALGNIEGCPNGWDSSEKAPKECLISDNWRETQRFTSTKEDDGGYYGTLTKDGSEDYQTTEFRCIVDTDDKEIRCGYYSIINDPDGRVFKILVNKDLSAIKPVVSIE